MRRLGLITTVAATLLAAPLAASAQQAYALAGANIFAGPGGDYPVVATVAPGVRLRINGCLSDWQWCDVSFGPNRGWAYAGDLGYTYYNNRVPVIEYGPRLALPVITFSLGSYWDRYYRGRPWYHERSNWERHWNEHRYDYRNEYRGNQNWNGNHNGNQNWNRGNNEYRGNDNARREQRYEQQPRQEYRGNVQPYSNSQAEQFRRDKEAGRDTTRDNAPRPGTMPPGSSQPPTTPGYYGGSG